MVDMRVGQYHGVDGFGGNGECIPVPTPELLEALEKSAIEQNLAAIVLDEMAAAGNSTGSA